MPIELKVPPVGESVTEVIIADWLSGIGSRVERDQNIAVIETDKATVELPAPVSGVITAVLKGKGQPASVGEVIGLMEEGEAPGAGSGAASSGAGAAAASAGNAEKAATVSMPKEGQAAPAPEGWVMPSAQRLLAETGTDVKNVTASGPGGRVLKEDVQKALARDFQPPGTGRDPAAAEAPGSAGPSASAPSSAMARPAAPSPAPASAASSASSYAAPSPAPYGSRQEEAVPMTLLRKKVAERLVQAQQNAALLTTFNEVDMSAVMALRSRHQEAFQKEYGIKLGFMSFFVKAVVEALKRIPQLNAEIRGDHIVYRNYFDIGVAVGGGKGLVVPVLRNAERQSLAEVEAAIADFAVRARDNKIKLDELQGGTFTLSNGGVYGSMLSTPIVNPPQSGVLGMHAIQDRPVAREGQVVIRPMMYLALTYDHRIVDGREAVTFLKRVKDILEEPARLLLEI